MPWHESCAVDQRVKFIAEWLEEITVTVAITRSEPVKGGAYEGYCNCHRNPNVRDQFKKKLQERLQSPHVPTAKLSGMPDCYKIKLRAAGYRLVYRVDDAVVTVVVVAVGRGDRNLVYKIAAGRV